MDRLPASCVVRSAPPRVWSAEHTGDRHGGRHHRIAQRAELPHLLSVALAWWVSPNWLWFTAFVGANLLQSSFTKFCPLEKILGYFGLAGCKRAA